MAAPVQPARRSFLKVLAGELHGRTDTALRDHGPLCFIAMYRPHAAREDTPALRSLVSAHEYDAMAEELEKKERQLFGDYGFEKMAQRVAGLEQDIGIGELGAIYPCDLQQYAGAA